MCLNIQLGRIITSVLVPTYMAAKIWKATGKPWSFLRRTFGLKHSSATPQGELWAHLSIRLSLNHFKSDPTTGLFPLLFQIQLLKKENKTNLIMLGWEAQLNVRVTATSPTKSQTSNVTTGSAKSRLETTYCYHQQNMDWDKASGVEEAKWSCWRNCPFPSAGDSALILPLNHQHRGEMVQKATFCHFQTNEISSIHYGHIRSLQNPSFSLLRQQQMPISIFLCQYPDLQSRILKFSGCSITESSSIWGVFRDSLGRCLLQGIPPVLLASGISWEGNKVKLSTCPTAIF